MWLLTQAQHPSYKAPPVFHREDHQLWLGMFQSAAGVPLVHELLIWIVLMSHIHLAHNSVVGQHWQKIVVTSLHYISSHSNVSKCTTEDTVLAASVTREQQQRTRSGMLIRSIPWWCRPPTNIDRENHYFWRDVVLQRVYVHVNDITTLRM